MGKQLRFALALALTSLFVWGANGSLAATRSWNNGSGNWSVAGNWSPAGVPTAGDTANITLTDGISRTINYDYTGPAITLGNLIVDLQNYTGADTTTFAMTTNNLTSVFEYVGYSGAGGTNGVGTFNQTGGTNTINGAGLYLAVNPTDIGYYNLSGTGSLAASGGWEYVGYAGVGSFNQPAGTNTIFPNNYLYVGFLAGSTGTYTLGGTGTLTANSYEYIGYSGTGTFNQTGGTHTMGPNLILFIGNNSGSMGTYNLSGGTLTAGYEYVGASGMGNFNQSGGKNTINAGYSLVVGASAGGGGAYSLSGGSLMANGSEYVGYLGTGSFNLTGGAYNFVSSMLHLGYSAGSTGNYTLSDGDLNAQGGEIIGESGTGNFNQTSFFTFHTIGPGASLILGYNAGAIGTFTLSGPLSAGGPEYVGLNGTGIFTQNSITDQNSNTIASGYHLYLGYNVGSTGTYNLTSVDGSIAANGNEYVGFNGNGTFNQSSGTNTIAAGGILAIANSSGSSGTYALSGGTLIAPTVYVGGNTGGAGGAGVLSVSAGGTLTTSGTLKVYDTAGSAVNLSGGTINVGAIDLSGNFTRLHWTSGTLHLTNSGVTIDDSPSANLGSSLTLGPGQTLIEENATGPIGGEFIGSTGTGSLTQTGGINNVAGGYNIYLGRFIGSSGTYTLSGGLLNASSYETVGDFGAGIFNQSGGTNRVTYGLVLAEGTTSTAAFTLSGGGLTNYYEDFGAFGTSVFTQTAGTSSTLTELDLARGTLGTATYNLSGGSAACGSVYVGGGAAAGAGGTGVLTVSGTGVLTVAAALTAFNTPGTVINLNGGTINAGALNFNGVQSLLNWTSGTLNLTVNVTFDSGAAATSTSAAFGPTLTLAANQTFKVTANETLGGAGPFSLILNSGSAHYVIGNLTVSPSGTLTQNAGSYLYAAAFTQAGGTINGTLQNQGAFAYQSGAFNGRLLNQGTVSFVGNFTVGNGVENDTTLTLTGGQTLTVHASGMGGTGIDNFGSLIVSGGMVGGDAPVLNEFGGTISGHGVITPPLTNNGTLTVSDILALSGGATNFGLVQGNGTISGGFANNAAGTVNVGGGNSLAITSDWPDAGLVVLQGQSARLGGGAITNTGSIQGQGLINSTVANSGTVEALGGTLSFGGMLTNPAGGLLTSGTGTKLLVNTGLAANAGVINLTGGTFDNNGHPMNNTGQISGWGIFRTGGTGLDNNGSITFTGGLTTINGPVTNENGRTITVAQNPAIFTGLVTNNMGGTFRTTNATATFAGGFTNNGNSNFASAGNGTIDIPVVPSLGAGSSMAVGDTSTLKFSAGTGTAAIGTAVTATVSSGATLELAGSVSALSSGANRVNITNNSSSAGILVTGTNQQVGNIDGAGTTQVNAGSDLTANHIIQSALGISGTAVSHGLVTIAASDSSGNPLGIGDSLGVPALAGSATPATSTFAVGDIGGDPVPVGNGASDTGGLTAAVPEPSSLLLVLLAIAGGSVAALRTKTSQ
jgi:fibronectin-binding autotransporter adhesin